MIFIKTLMNADRIYLLNKTDIGPNSNYKKTFCGYKNKCFHAVKNPASSFEKTTTKTAPLPSENQMV